MFGVIFKSFKKFFKCLAKHLKKLLNVCQTFQIFFKCLKHFKSFSNVCRLLNVKEVGSLSESGEEKWGFYARAMKKIGIRGESGEGKWGF